MSTEVQSQETVSEKLMAFWEQRLRPALETMEQASESPEEVANVLARVERPWNDFQEQVLHALMFLYRTAAKVADGQKAYSLAHLYQSWIVPVNVLLNTRINIEEALEDLFEDTLLPGEAGFFAVADNEEVHRQLNFLIPLIKKRQPA